MIQAVFYAKRPADLYNEYAVAATNRRLLLLMLNYFGRVTGMAGEAPRQTRLGPCSGILRAIPSLSAGKTRPSARSTTHMPGGIVRLWNHSRSRCEAPNSSARIGCLQAGRDDAEPASGVERDGLHRVETIG